MLAHQTLWFRAEMWKVEDRDYQLVLRHQRQFGNRSHFQSEGLPETKHFHICTALLVIGHFRNRGSLVSRS